MKILRNITSLSVFFMLIQSGRASEQAVSRSNPTQIVVMVVVDQMRYDFLSRFQPVYSNNGFLKILKNGASFANAHYSHVPTFTAAGHANIHTGSVPSHHGIVANYWFDRETKKNISSVGDTAHQLVASPSKANDPLAKASLSKGASPHLLMSTTFGDQLQMSNNFKSKVVSLSLKDRSAVLSGGKRPTAAYWFDDNIGAVVTSTYYMKTVPAWVNGFNTKHSVANFKGKTWNLLLPESLYASAQAKNIVEQKSVLGSQFPYTLNNDANTNVGVSQQFGSTPFANTYLVDLAKAAIEGEQLGARGVTDLLALSFSATDSIGHSYGPDSRETMDTYARLDRDIANLISFLEKKYGKNFIFCLTADHGVSPVPEYISTLKIPAFRLSEKEVKKIIEENVEKAFGMKNLVEGVGNDQIYLNRELIAARKLKAEDIERAAGEAAIKIKGVRDYVTATQLREGRMPFTTESARLQNGFSYSRSGDVYLKLQPFVIFSDYWAAATHGSGYSYDTHVPILFYGQNIKPLRSYKEVSPSDIVPTLAAYLDVEPPAAATGKIIEGLFK